MRHRKRRPAGCYRNEPNLFVALYLTTDKDAEVEQLLGSALPLVMREADTTAWLAIRFGRSEYGIFDVFPDDAGRFAHLAGHVPRELAKHALSLLGGVPDMDMIDVPAQKLPAP